MIKAISKTLKTNFIDANIEIEQIKQGMNKPCFFIWQINKVHEYLISNKTRQEYNFVIRYFDDTKTYSKLKETGDKLLNIFNIITYNDVVFKCKNLTYRIEDSVLQFYFDVWTKWVPDDDTNKFGELEVDTNVED